MATTSLVPPKPSEASYGSGQVTVGNDAMEMNDSVYVGATHHGNVVHEQHIHNYPSQPTHVHTVVHHVHSVAPLPDAFLFGSSRLSLH